MGRPNPSAAAILYDRFSTRKKSVNGQPALRRIFAEQLRLRDVSGMKNAAVVENDSIPGRGNCADQFKI